MSDESTFTQEQLEAAIKEATKGLEKNRDEALTEAKAAKEAARKLRETWGDLDAKEVKQLLKDKAEAKKKKAEADGDWAAREKQLTEAHAKEKDAWKAREGKLLKTVEKSLVTSELTKAITAKKGDAELLLPHAQQYVEVEETDDGFQAFVTDGKGSKAFADGTGTPMNFDQLVETKLAAAYPRAFDGTGSSGSGASKSAGGPGGGDGKKIAAGDNQAFLENLEGIAKGEVQVEPAS